MNEHELRMNAARALHQLGQSLWLDDIRRTLFDGAPSKTFGIGA